jgi:hypothetical protein
MEERFTWPRGSDFNLDQVFTISDIWLAAGWLFHFPGDLAIAALLNAGFGTFLEMTTASFGGVFSGIVSFMVYMLLLNGARAAFED